jgi:hypothetical protein
MESGQSFHAQQEVQRPGAGPDYSDEYVHNIVASIKSVRGVESAAESDNGPLLSTVDEHRDSYQQLRSEYGDKYFAFELGFSYFQNSFYSESKNFRAGRDAAKSFIPEILANPELAEIFSTSFELRAEKQRLHELRCNSVIPVSEEEREENEQKATAADEKFKALYKEILADAKPIAEPEPKSVLPTFCAAAGKYETQQQPIPQEHKDNCSICLKQ